MNEKVSIIIPTFNQVTLFKKALNSAMNQTYKNIEIIIIDDNVNTKISSQIQEYIKLLSTNKISYYKNNENLGSAASRNRGAKLSTGKYITFLDDDDIYLPNKVKFQVENMILEQTDYSFTNIKLYDANGYVEFRKRKYLKKTKDIKLLHLKHHITCTSSLMFLRNFFLDIGGFDNLDLGDEFYLMYKATNKSNKYTHINKVLVEALIDSNTGLSSFQNKIKTEQMLFEFKKKQFNSLSFFDKRHIKMRHNAVKAVAYYRNKQKVKTIKYVLLSFLNSPAGFFKLLFGFYR